MSGNMDRWNVMKRLLRYIGKYRLLVPMSFALAAVSVVSSLYVPIVIGQAIDLMIGPGHVLFADLAICLVKVIFAACMAGFSTWVMDLVNNKIVYHTVQDLRDEMMAKIVRLPIPVLDTYQTGDMTQRMIADAEQVGDGLLLGTQQLFKGILTILCTLVVMFSCSSPITVLILVLTPLSFMVAKLIAHHSYDMFQKQNATRGKTTAFIQEATVAQKVIRSYGGWHSFAKDLHGLNDELMTYSEKAVFWSSLTNPCTRAVNNLIYAATALAGIFAIDAGTMTVGGLSMMLSYANQYMKPFNDITSVITEFQNALSSAARIFAVLDDADEVDDGVISTDTVKGEIALQDVAFSYTDVPFMENLSITIKAGQKVALVGATGSGKTTFMNLLMRFYEVQHGAIKIDGVDIRDIPRCELPSIFGMVLQDAWLKEGTIRENILFGKEDATEEEIIAACRKACSWDFIRRMPNGLDEPIDASSLSQGEKQLLCITRVMLKKPPVLILDEATSSIDACTERKVQDAFDALMQDRTCIVAAHRLSTIRNADMILVMENGQIIEKGTHKELLQHNGAYEKLYSAQFEGK